MSEDTKKRTYQEYVQEYFDQVPEWKGIDDLLEFRIVTTEVEGSAPSGNLPVVRLDSWRLLAQLWEVAFASKDWVFRGHRRFDWSLSPTLGRSTEGIIRKPLAERQLERFKKAVRGRLKDNSILLQNGSNNADEISFENDVELWALGQHHGLHTPLLDWTHSPYVALFFSFDENNNQFEKENPYRVIYALNKAALKENDPHEDIPIIEPKIDDHGRLVNQAGLFIMSPYDNTIENEIVNILGQNDVINVDNPNELAKYICKIYVKNDEISECRQNLRSMNIHHASLFPDLIGASNYCNADVSQDNLQLDLASGDIEKIKKINMDLIRVPKGKIADDNQEREWIPLNGEEIDTAPEYEKPEPIWQSDFDILSLLELGMHPIEQLGEVMEELQDNLNSLMVTDWERKESAQAAMRNSIRRILREHGVDKDKTLSVAKKIVADAVEIEIARKAQIGNPQNDETNQAEIVDGARE